MPAKCWTTVIGWCGGSAAAGLVTSGVPRNCCPMAPRCVINVTISWDPIDIRITITVCPPLASVGAMSEARTVEEAKENTLWVKFQWFIKDRFATNSRNTSYGENQLESDGMGSFGHMCIHTGPMGPFGPSASWALGAHEPTWARWAHGAFWYGAQT